MTFILLIGVLGVLIVVFFKNSLINTVQQSNKLIHKLQNAKWFQSYLLSGIFLFMMNFVLFFFTVTVLYELIYLVIPFAHILVMFLAVIGSIYLWIVIKKAWQGTKRNRLKMGIIGSSFYFFLTVIFFIWFVTLKPSNPGDDTFMGAIGLVFAIIVTIVAFSTCFIITGFSKNDA